MTIINYIIKYLYRKYLNFKIKSLERSIKYVESNIYFHKWSGKDCIEHNNYCYDKIEYLKNKLC